MKISFFEKVFDDDKLFTRWTDPKSGIDSYILTHRVAPIQQSFYFVNPSLTIDGRFYWFYCSFPPSGNASSGRTLGCVDFKKREVRHFPDTQFQEASPLVDLIRGDVYWSSGSEVWKRSPLENGKSECINSLSAGFTQNRHLSHLATHFTFSADKKMLNLDSRVGEQWYVGDIPLNGGEITVWEQFPIGYKHAQFSPTDSDLMLLAQDFYSEFESGKIHGYENRLWLLRKGAKAQPIFPFAEELPQGSMTRINSHSGTQENMRDPRSMQGHEWWSADGKHVWYVHYGEGVERVEIGKACPRPELVWPLRKASHAHCNALESYVIADNIPLDDENDQRVVFLNRKTGKEINVVSHLPGLLPWGGNYRKYHVHPHPQFCGCDNLICYTTTVLGQPDIAFTSVESLIQATQ